MRLLIQRVSQARVRIDGAVVGEIGTGLLVLVGLGRGDSEAMFGPAVEKLANLRIFPDAEGNMNRSCADVSGGILVVSQFTLYADARKGRRPSFIDAMAPAEARDQFGAFVARLRKDYSAGPVATGVFGAMMEVELINDGPVTIWLDSADMPWGKA